MASAGKHQAYLDAERQLFDSEDVAVTQRYVPLERLRGKVRVLEAGTGPPVLFVSGAMTTGAIFARMAAALPDYRCLLLERPGTGLTSPLLPAPTNLESQQQAADVLLCDVLDGLDIEAAHVVSTALGSWMTYRSAAMNPDRFNSIFGLGFQGGARVSTASASTRVQVSHRIKPLAAPTTHRKVRSLVKSLGMGGALESGDFSDPMVDWMVALFRNTDTFRNESLHNPQPIGLRGPNRDVRHPTELLKKLHMRVGLLWGEDDVFGGRSSAQAFAAELPNSRLQLIDGAGHAPWLGASKHASEALRAHLAEARTSARREEAPHCEEERSSSRQDLRNGIVSG